ncbi:hypothetical protein [Leptospira stimsonii]|uniref:NERD domain-containing protein n=1 Tax=Leptospira stimsonii TaxID=2202203 RepID=A0ABY2N4S2_9LEPT|nr:hypothetical protein [Leptospira stimsonii]TGK23583.1 hypothetical protein EHO98_04965 [Leptospira stimsonii]TGM16928.1 hypothetical protein EHQ90_08500 [Leptospira stimsonii]
MSEEDVSGNINGIDIVVFDPKVKWNENVFIGYCKKYNRLDLLRRISSLSKDLSGSKKPIIYVDEIPCSLYLLNRFCLFAIKHSSDTSTLTINKNDFKLCLRMLFSSAEVEVSALTDEPKEIINIISFQQRTVAESILHCISRIIYIYLELWKQIPEANGINVLDEIEDIIGIPYDNAIVFSYMSWGNSESYFYELSENHLKEISDKLKINFRKDSHRKFLNWCSAKYEFYKNYSGLIDPIVKHPVFDTDTTPVGQSEKVFIVLSANHLIEKVTINLYYELIDRFNAGDGENSFKVAYGYVFQAYVGNLLKYHLKSWKIDPETKYSTKNLLTVDWIICKDEKIILIEVKQSSIFLNSKITGSLESIKNDISKTIAKGIKQLKRTEDDIKSGKYPELNKYKGKTDFIKLIVVGDTFFNVNSIVKDLLFEENQGPLDGFHIIGIEEFEKFLEFQKGPESIFEIIRFKELNEEYRNVDFDVYIRKIYSDKLKDYRSSFLYEIHERFFDGIIPQD